MKTLKTVEKGDKVIVTVEISKGEKLLSVRDDSYYRLGDPLNDVVPSHVIADATPATWCCLEQKWES